MSILCCSDLHGRYDLYKQIKAFLKPEDKVYYLGDAGDRGPEPWETLKACLKDPQFIYIKGNHDDMLVKAFWEATAASHCGHDYGSIALLAYNGGTKTFEGLMAEPERTNWAAHIHNLPTWESRELEDGTIEILSHAGFTPYFYKHNEVPPQFSHKDWLIMTAGAIKIPKEQDLLWDREHILEDWDNLLPNVKIIHGHTFSQYVYNDVEFWKGDGAKPFECGAFWYCDDHKVCIDNGSFFTGIAVLLDLDTFEEHIFKA